MQANQRRERRWQSDGAFTICWEDESGIRRSTPAQCEDMSSSGMRVRCADAIKPGTVVFLQGPDGAPNGYCVVRYCNTPGSEYAIGIEFNDETKVSVPFPVDDSGDYYEFLQISPKASMETIRRIYRFLAGRFHPDNPDTGDPEKFLFLNRIYQTLSNPERRAEYDATRQQQTAAPDPSLNVNSFVNGVQGEVNRRLAILGLLYNKRRMNSQDPGISMWELEGKMTIPREHLEFATWYLKAKGYVSASDNSDLMLTALGVDYVEGNVDKDPTLHKLLCAGRNAMPEPGMPGAGGSAHSVK